MGIQDYHIIALIVALIYPFEGTLRNSVTKAWSKNSKKRLQPLNPEP